MESARPSQQRKNAHGTRVAPCMDAEAAPSPRAPMAALESTLNAEAEDSVVKPETALTTTEDAEEDNDAVGPLEAWGETKEPEKEERKGSVRAERRICRTEPPPLCGKSGGVRSGV